MATYHYRSFRIVPKLDFGSGPGYFINGKYIKKGWVVVSTQGAYVGCNAMPGAAWFQTVAQAKRAIDILIAVGAKPGHTDGCLCDSAVEEFWSRVQAPTDREMREIAALRAALKSAESICAQRQKDAERWFRAAQSLRAKLAARGVEA